MRTNASTSSASHTHGENKKPLLVPCAICGVNTTESHNVRCDVCERGDFWEALCIENGEKLITAFHAKGKREALKIAQELAQEIGGECISVRKIFGSTEQRDVSPTLQFAHKTQKK